VTPAGRQSPRPGGARPSGSARPRRPARRRPAPPPVAALGSPGRRLTGGLLGLGVLLSVLGARLVQLQGLDATSYAVQAEDQRRHTVALPAVRGSILDRSGVPLAMSVDARLVYADPQLVTEPANEARRLSPYLHLPPLALEPRLRGAGSRPGSRYVVLARGLQPADGRAIQGLDLAGIEVLPESRRVYPAGSLAGSVVGFTDHDGNGAGGLELALDRSLAGRDGRLTAELGLDGRAIPAGRRVELDPVPGADVELTIDSDIQWRAEQAITAAVSATGAHDGTAIVMDPRTGEVLALATAPSYDPSMVARTKKEDLGNRAVSEVYEPGSVNKVITTAAALSLGAVQPDTVITVPPTYKVYDKTFHDAESHSTERLTVTGVLAKSSNIGTIQIAEKVGKDRLYSFLRAFGFGETTGVGLPGESRGILPPPATWSGTQLPTIAFGQGVSVTALQMASVYATVANGGMRVAPRLVRGTVGADGLLDPADPAPARRVLSPRVSTQLRVMLEAATTPQGTAPLAQIPGYRVAGKTGTAQRADGPRGYRGGSYTSSFVGFAPADHPELVVAIVLQDPVRGHFGGVVAAPVFRQVMSFALQARRISPTGTRPPTAVLSVP
jgi:cell division protein FtsI (penicillin-binding protein 3)